MQVGLHGLIFDLSFLLGVGRAYWVAGLLEASQRMQRANISINVHHETKGHIADRISCPSGTTDDYCAFGVLEEQGQHEYAFPILSASRSQ